MFLGCNCFIFLGYGLFKRWPEIEKFVNSKYQLENLTHFSTPFGKIFLSFDRNISMRNLLENFRFFPTIKIAVEFLPVSNIVIKLNWKLILALGWYRSCQNVPCESCAHYKYHKQVGWNHLVILLPVRTQSLCCCI